ncbi:hypothetical protein NXC24_PA00155 (plasmid) [Rhizobium sp. NXC24]|nr:hypothetical protein NXC24_PA00155 [Rhizobium sp. NXC24]
MKACAKSGEFVIGFSQANNATDNTSTINCRQLPRRDGHGFVGPILVEIRRGTHLA